jgi:3-dehydroshikimate dehydratase
MAWISRNAIYGNSQKIERCFAGGSCDPDMRKGGIVFGLPSGEHERYVGKRGTGVAPSPGSLAKMCPDGAPNCQAPPNGGLAAPTLGSVRKRAGELIVQGELRGKPLSRSPWKYSAIGRRAAAKAKCFSARSRPPPTPRGGVDFR